MPRWERPYSSSEEACRAAQENCIRERGHFCEAYGGIICKSCSKYKEGIIRRKKKFTKEEKETISYAISEDNKIVRLRKDENYFYLEIGKFVDSPQLFITERSIVINKEEMSAVKQLVAMVKT